MFNRLFIDHPQSVGESYLQHFAVAGRFGLRMIGGGLGALLHAFIPGLCQHTGSKTLERLNRNMLEQRKAKTQAVEQMKTVDWVI